MFSKHIILFHRKRKETAPNSLKAIKATRQQLLHAIIESIDSKRQAKCNTFFSSFAFDSNEKSMTEKIPSKLWSWLLLYFMIIINGPEQFNPLVIPLLNWDLVSVRIHTHADGDSVILTGPAQVRITIEWHTIHYSSQFELPPWRLRRRSFSTLLMAVRTTKHYSSSYTEPSAPPHQSKRFTSPRVIFT